MANMQITVVTQSGARLALAVDPATTIGAVKTMLHQQYGGDPLNGAPPAEMQIMIFAGTRLMDDQTLADYGIPNGAAIHMTLNLRGDIGEWLQPSAADRRLLFSADNAISASSAEVFALVRAAAGPAPPLYAKPLPAAGGCDAAYSDGPLLDKMRCTAVVEHIERELASSGSPDSQRDMKLEIAEADLIAIVGAEALAGLRTLGNEQLKALGADPTTVSATFKLRRRAGTTDDVIPFHRDSSLVVVNVALNDDFDGAQLLFALGDRIVCPTRAAGTATAHDCRIVHGVTRLGAGVRYNLYAVYERPAAAA